MKVSCVMSFTSLHRSRTTTWQGLKVVSAHHSHVVQHASVNTSLVKVTFVLREADVVQPPWNKQTLCLSHEEKCRYISFNKDDVTLTVHPVVVQFALQVVVLWAESL